MTTAIEVTKRKMQTDLIRVGGMISTTHLFKTFKESLEAHLEAVRQDRDTLTTERDTLRNRVQVLEMANATSGEVIRGLKDEATQARRARMKARLHEYIASAPTPVENVASATLDGNTATILGALVDAQRIMTDYLVPDGIRAKEAMGKIIPVLDNEKLCLAMDAFEQPKEEITGASLSAKYFSNRTIASVAIDKMVRNLMRGKSGCMHSFHPAFQSGELCTFCGVGK